ncbi:MAG TPA: class II aldolase/adducin family protein [Candidatus Ornithomonoglobus intestinigallinarum]|uniref:Class II aldolase/adducin family protein n=1 Tax=Candidatus Ornithomonoglobus intestinigallinarum TaxID=2840894 RepID=A0A9D1H467_9FIRM|nr:class II aldolase/adducin family protein [Candidatus Ornithomonoglobus intestinigallinarum]
MNLDMLHPADQLVMFMERIYGYGMTTTSGGNLSILDDNGDIWITPGSIDKGSLTRHDMICIKPDGTIIGNHKPSSEYPFHQHIYKTRPDIKAVLHAHPPALVAFSIVRKLPSTSLIPNVKFSCGEIGMAKYGLPGSQDLGDKISAEFEKGFNTVILENHGVVIGAKTMFDAFKSFETLDFSARLEIDANNIGTPVKLTPEQIDWYKSRQNVSMDEFVSNHITSEEKTARRDMCKFIKRAYNQQLFTSTQGTFSQRLSDDSFVITPAGPDRKYLEPEDIVKINGDYKEMGKSPSRSVELHREIYKQHPHINSIIIAHPPCLMAFAVTDEPLDSRTIPESYILMRNIPKLDFGSNYLKPKETAAVFKENTPIAIIKNDCVIVTGSDLLNAFDRLEVAEYSARAIIAAKDLGDVVAINDDEIEDIIKAFHLVK